MPAFQRIEMPGRPAMFDAMDQLGQSLGQLGDQRDRQAREATANKRQEGQDYQSALAKAQALLESGDIQGAHATMAPYKSRLVEDHKAAIGAGPVPGGPQAGMQAPQAPPPQGGSPMPDAAEFDTDHGQTPEQLGQGPIDPKFVDSLPMGAPKPQAPPTNAETLMAAQAGTKSRDQTRARQLLAFTPPGGQEITMDPQAGKDARREQRVAQLDQAFADSTDPLVQKHYPRLRAIAASSDEEVKPTDALRYFQHIEATEQAGATADSKAAAQADAALARRTALDDRLTTTRRGQDMALEGNKYKADSWNKNPLKEGAAATAVATRVDTEWDRWYKQQDVKKVLGGERMLASASANIGSGNPLAEHDAQVSLGRFFRGGMPTEGEMHLLYKNLAGRIGNALPAFFEKMERGGLTSAEVGIVKEAIVTAQQEQRRALSHVLKSARAEFGPGTGHDNLAGNMNAKWRGALAGFGLDDAEMTEWGDLYTPEAGGGPVPIVEYGKGNPQVDKHRPKAPGKASTKAKSTADYLKELDTP